MMRGLFNLRTAGIACLALAAAAAAGALDPGRAAADHALPLYIADVKPGMTRAQVRHTLGRPKRIVTNRRQGVAFERQWRYPDHLAVGFGVLEGRTREVEWVRTRTPKDRFDWGIHVGAKEHRLRRLGNVECWHLTVTVGSFPPGWVCAWRPPWNADACGPHLTFLLNHRHGRIKMIQLSGVPSGRRGSALQRDGCI